MTKFALLATLALCAAPVIVIAADAQTARAPASGTATSRASRLPSGVEIAAQQKQVCQDAYAHTVGDVAYLEARLNPTPAQQPLFDRWKSVKMEIARRDMADCATRESSRAEGKVPTLLETMAREEDTLKRRLADLEAEFPTASAFYNVLNQTQKDAWDHPDQQGMMMPRFRNFTGMSQRATGYGAAGPGFGVPASPAPAPAQVAAAPAPLKRDGDQSFLTSVFGGNKPIVNKINMTSYGKDKTGHFRVTLADGEVWQIRSEGDSQLPNWHAPAERLVVSIFEGALGSYNMEVSDDSQVYKVNRMN